MIRARKVGWDDGVWFFKDWDQLQQEDSYELLGFKKLAQLAVLDTSLV